jgi:hypothetical protein
MKNLLDTGAHMRKRTGLCAREEQSTFPGSFRRAIVGVQRTFSHFADRL